MKKMMMAVAGLAMAVVMTGCGGSPKSVAEKFALAIIQKDPAKALEFYDPVKRDGATKLRTSEQIKTLKEELETMGKDTINDDKYECEAILEVITVPREDSSYTLINGKKYTGETATVTVQFVKGKDKKSSGLRVNLEKVDGSWLVTGQRYISDGLDTTEKK